MSDQEAWHELCNLYLMEGEYSKAVFSMEEVLLHNPYSHLVHQRLGDIRYTMGGQDNIEIAKSYYAQAIKLNGNNLRALYGLYLVSSFEIFVKSLSQYKCLCFYFKCCGHIATSKAPINKRKEAQKLSSWAMSKITQNTSTKNEENDDIAALEAAFGNLDARIN